MFNPTNVFNGLFGKVAAGQCRITMNGEIAVKCSSTNSYKTYNLAKKRLTNVTNFCFDAGDDFFFVIPTSKVEKGDIILVDGKPKCVLEKSSESIKVIDYDSSEIREVVPERHVFMGSTYFYGKIVSPILGSGLKGSKGGIGKILKMSMIMQMMGGNSNNSSNGGSQMMGGNSNNSSNGGFMNGSMGQMMAMSMMMGGKDNLFGDMFNDLSLDFGTDDDTNDEDSNEEEA